MYIYSGWSLITTPEAWHWAVPFVLKGPINFVVPIDTFLRLQGVLELAMALLFPAWFLKPNFIKWVALISFLEMAAIVAVSLLAFNETNFLITFRDIGLLSGVIVLTMLLFKEDRLNS